jgi:hypothetical protein
MYPKMKEGSSEEEEDDEPVGSHHNEVDPKTAILETTTMDLINSRPPEEKVDLLKIF